MYWKALVAVVVIVVAAAAGSYVAYQYYYTQESASHNELAGPTYETPVPAQPATPASPQLPRDFGTATIKTIGTTSITVIHDTTGQVQTYAISKDTPVFSLVPVGQTGRPFSELRPGVKVKLAPLKDNPTTLYWIAFARDPALEPTDEEIKHPLFGTVTAVSADSITVASAPPVVVSIAPTTQVVVTVTAGEVAKPAQAQTTSAVVWGVHTSDRSMAARVVILTPLLAGRQ